MSDWTPTTTGSGTAFAVDNYGRTGTVYGSASLDAANPEVVATDDMEVSLDHWGSGEHAYTKWSAGTDAWWAVGLVLLRAAGSLGGGPSTQIQVTLPIEFLTAGLAALEGGSYPILAPTGANIATAAFSKLIVWLKHVSGTGSGALFKWQIDWLSWNTGSEFITGSTVSAASLITGSKRMLTLRVRCTSAAQTDITAPTDGSISLSLDGATVAEQTAIDPYVNWVSGNPGVLNQWSKLGIGFAGLPGPVGLFTATDVISGEVGDLPVDLTDPCCATPPGTSSSGGSVSPPDDDLIVIPASTFSCSDQNGMIPVTTTPAAGEQWV